MKKKDVIHKWKSTLKVCTAFSRLVCLNRYCSGLVSMAAIKYFDKETSEGRKGLVGWQFHITAHDSREVKVGARCRVHHIHSQERGKEMQPCLCSASLTHTAQEPARGMAPPAFSVCLLIPVNSPQTSLWANLIYMLFF